MNNFAADCCRTDGDYAGKNSSRSKEHTSTKGSQQLQWIGDDSILGFLARQYPGSQSVTVVAQACELQLFLLMVRPCHAIYQIGNTNTPNGARDAERGLFYLGPKWRSPTIQHLVHLPHFYSFPFT